MKIIIFMHPEHFLPSLTGKTDDNDTLFLSIPNTGILKTLASTSYALLVYYVLYKKHSRFSCIALLSMPRLSEFERSGTIGMLKAGVSVSDVARYHNCHPSTMQRLRDRYQATLTVRDRHRSG